MLDYGTNVNRMLQYPLRVCDVSLDDKFPEDRIIFISLIDDIFNSI